jgi:F-type H+-transporting ATPase subunit delta
MTVLEGKRAARALFHVTRQNGDARPTLDALQAFSSVVLGHEELRATLLSPFVPGQIKRTIVERIAATMPMTDAALQTLRILADTQSEGGFAPFLKEYTALVHRLERRVDAEVVTAVPLTEAQLAQVRDALAQATGQQVSLTSRVDPAVIGGAVTRVGSVLYDGSLARQLARIKEQFVEQG